jgi:aldehyde dehydrogenase (NAD+)
MNAAGSLAPVAGNFIAGQWEPARPSAAFEDRNPADREDLIGRFPDSSREDVERALAGVAQGSRAWATAAPETRSAVLDKAAAIMAARADDIARELTREEGKTHDEARMEARRIAANFRFYAGEALRLRGETYPAEGSQVVLTLRQPIGVVAVITPWNFPLAMPARKLAPALAVGNGVVFKPSEVTPLMGQRLVEVLLEAGLPPATIALVQGRGAVVGKALVADARVNAITFTGSYAVGRAIAEAAGTDTRVQLEMGGKNATVVLEDADVERAAAIIVRGAFGLSGQACTGTSRVLVAGALHDRLVARLAALADNIVVGNGATPGVTMGPLASEAQLDKVLRYIELGRAEGGRVVAGGERVGGAGCERGCFVRPTVFVDLPASSRLLREEIFGPVVTVQRIADLDDAIGIANDTEYGLAAAVITSNLEHALRFAHGVDAGVVKVNAPTTGVALTAPFGGFRHSSNQAAKEQAGATVMDFYSRIKTVYLAA